MKQLLKSFKSLGLLLCILCYAIYSHAAPKKDLWPRWQVNDPTSTQTIDHSAYARFLARYVSTNAAGINLVSYKSVTPSDRQALQGYINYLTSLPIDHYTRRQQLAYWINLYNALTIVTVLNHYPVKSILDINISPGMFSKGPWDAKLIKIEGEQLSLNDIEHRILRPIWQDPRVHYTLNCASYSCPNLQKTPYSADQVNMQLTQAAIGYINDPRGVLIANKRLTVSKIYDWYQADFGGSEQGVLTHLMKYANPALKQQLQSFRRIDDYMYNWALNNL